MIIGRQRPVAQFIQCALVGCVLGASLLWLSGCGASLGSSILPGDSAVGLPGSLADDDVAVRVGPNVVKNPSFETGDVKPDNWKVPAPSGGNQANYDTTVALDGARSFKITSVGEPYAKTYQQQMPIKGSTKYRVSVWIKTQNVKILDPQNSYVAKFLILNSAGVRVRKLWLYPRAGTRDWALLEDYVTTPPGAVAGHITMMTDGVLGTVWYDNVSVNEVTSEDVPTKSALSLNRPWIDGGKVRGAFFWMDAPRNHLPELKDAGINLAIIKFTQNDMDWPAEAEKVGINLLGSTNYFSYLEAGADDKVKRYGPMVRFDGAAMRAPCPLNRDYWVQEMLPLIKIYASKSLQYPTLVGDAIDLEMYGINPDGTSGGTVDDTACFCDHCWNLYLTKRGLSANVAAADRYKWLTDKNKVNDYYRFLEDNMAAISTSVAKNVYAVNSKFVLGLINYTDDWYSRGIARGFGINKHPVFIMPEKPSYRFGWGPTLTNMVAGLQQRGVANPVLLPGLWMGAHMPAALRDEMVAMAQSLDGYWLFSTASFYQPGDPPMGDSGLKLKSTKASYWKAIREASEIIEPGSTNG